MTDRPVNRDQFRDDGDLAVVHVPTGQRYYTWPYERLDMMSEVIVEGVKNDTAPDGQTYDTGAIADMAFTLLRERLAFSLRSR